MINNLPALIAAEREGLRAEYLFFWSHHANAEDLIGKHCLSQWYPSTFTVDGISYPAAEHYMMAEKARLFGDEETRKKILFASTPEQAKKLGKLVKGFDNETWIQHRFDIVVRGNEAKFGQNEAIKKFLLETNNKVLVEASPFDDIWGIGLAESDLRAAHPEQWKGTNLLGFALMMVRSMFAE